MTEEEPEERDEREVPEAPEAGDTRRAAEHARRRARVFGEVLPEVTADERPQGAGDEPTPGAEDEWLRANVPPHHGT